MAQRGQQKDLIARFADMGEEAIQKLMSTPGTDRLLGAFGKMRDEVDTLTKRVRGMDELEKRLTKLEREVSRLSKSSSGSTTRKTSSARKTTSTTARKRSR
jgi:peptide subunit release factor RF-3